MKLIYKRKAHVNKPRTLIMCHCDKFHHQGGVWDHISSTQKFNYKSEKCLQGLANKSNWMGICKQQCKRASVYVCVCGVRMVIAGLRRTSINAYSMYSLDSQWYRLFVFTVISIFDVGFQKKWELAIQR